MFPEASVLSTQLGQLRRALLGETRVPQQRSSALASRYTHGGEILKSQCPGHTPDQLHWNFWGGPGIRIFFFFSKTDGAMLLLHCRVVWLSCFVKTPGVSFFWGWWSSREDSPSFLPSSARMGLGGRGRTEGGAHCKERKRRSGTLLSKNFQPVPFSIPLHLVIPDLLGAVSS